ncbi:MAG: hypothetical protein WDZ31_05605, partial [Phycisphaeraceae bacterium]
EKALSTILDANITTLITCIVLGYTATAEVKGFAVTLGIGILATLFTALFLTRVILEAYIKFGKAKSMPQLPTLVPAVGRFLTPNVDWIGKRMIFFAVSGVLIVGGLLAITSRGQDMLDIEFRAGTQVAFNLAEDEQLPIAEARSRLAVYGEVGQAMQEARQAGQTLDPATLPSDAHRAAYEQLLDIQEAAEARRAEAQERGDVVEGPVDFSLLNQARVITVGDTVRTDEGMMAGGFSIATLVTDSHVVSDIVTAAFEDVLDPNLTRSVTFRGQDIDDVERASARGYILPVTGRDLGDVINRPELTAHDVQDYLGGVAIVLQDLDPTVARGEVERR